MRATRDRIRHAVLFEMIALLIAAPLGSFLFGVPIGHFGIVAAVSTTIAMMWNYVYNLGFDHAMLRLGKGIHKTPQIRIVHAALFEGGLLVALVPFIAWYLAVSLWQAFMMDIVLTGFYLFYTFAFNWAYDVVYPIPPPESSA